ncbi:response regulator transcription factor [Nakamurella flavida]|uniref:Response regulator transcription factor n=1 Tax=Nakamurella flavida TaxID=363630 RepID=A0A939C5Y7_9ACTN|nr:LuxR C-terminal-related transcriptional regulator [Nakamurella flavida]MBM9477434.1 response regulator transcription factor [Nakamurella flavida]MDP9777367.1 DNA-binding NarL/FixJ family response regulator [Nakamurella flavida]
MTTPSIGLSAAMHSPDSARELPVNGLLPSPRTPVHDAAPATGGVPLRGATVLLVDPDRATRESLQASLADIGIGRIQEAGSLEAVQEIAAESTGGDLALVSLTFGTQTPELITTLRRSGWNRVVALAPTADIGPVIDAVGAGVSGVLIGRRANPAAASIPSSIHELSSREIEVIRLVADGRSNKWIGDRLSLSALTVKSHLARIGRKLGTGDRAHMVALAMRAGVIS